MEEKLTSAEDIAVMYADILADMADLNKRLITELAQYRVMDAEEKQLQELVDKMGGGTSGN